MRDKKRIVMLLTAALLLTAAATLAFSPAAARYRAELTGDMIFQAKPLEKLSFADQEWTWEADACNLTFSLDQDVDGCRVYLAVSEGITDPDNLNVYLTIPGYSNIKLEGTCQPIPEVSELAKLFGQGYVYYFNNELEDMEEWIFSAKANEQFTLTVTGLQSAAEATSLMRLFVERVE